MSSPLVVLASKKSTHEYAADGQLIKKTIPVGLPPGLIPTDVITGTVQTSISLKMPSSISSSPTTTTTTTKTTVPVPIQTPLYKEEYKHTVEKQWIQDDTRHQMGLWFADPKRAPFTKRFLSRAYRKLMNKNLQVVLLQAQDTIPGQSPSEQCIRRISPSEFDQLVPVIGKGMIRQFIQLPDRLEEPWFPLVMVHPHTFDTTNSTATNSIESSLQSIRYISYALVPFPSSSDEWIHNWTDEQVQQFLVHSFVSEPPIEILPPPKQPSSSSLKK